jgi:hypothetical protein
VGRFEWTGPYKSRTYLYRELAEMADGTTKAAAEVVAERARGNLAAANRWVRIVPHKPFRIELDRAPSPHSVGSWDVSLVGDNPVALEYGHAPSGHFAGTKTKAPAGLYILHRAADLPAKSGPRMGRELRAQLGRGYSGDPKYGKVE